MVSDRRDGILDGRDLLLQLGGNALVQLHVGLRRLAWTERTSASSLHRPACDVLGDLFEVAQEVGVVRDELRHLRPARRPPPAPSPCRPAAAAAARPGPSVANWKSSSGVGSLVFAFFCAANSNQALSSAPFLAIASFRAAMDFSRPTYSGTHLCGKTTMSRRGSSGSVFGVLSSRLENMPVALCSAFLPQPQPHFDFVTSAFGGATPSWAMSQATRSADDSIALATWSAPPWPALHLDAQQRGRVAGRRAAPGRRTCGRAADRRDRRGPRTSSAAPGSACRDCTWWYGRVGDDRLEVGLDVGVAVLGDPRLAAAVEVVAHHVQQRHLRRRPRRTGRGAASSPRRPAGRRCCRREWRASSGCVHLSLRSGTRPRR